MCVLFWSLNKHKYKYMRKMEMHKSSQYKKWNEKCCRWDILIVLFLRDFLCICMCGMDILHVINFVMIKHIFSDFYKTSKNPDTIYKASLTFTVLSSHGLKSRETTTSSKLNGLPLLKFH